MTVDKELIESLARRAGVDTMGRHAPRVLGEQGQVLSWNDRLSDFASLIAEACARAAEAVRPGRPAYEVDAAYERGCTNSAAAIRAKFPPPG